MYIRRERRRKRWGFGGCSRAREFVRRDRCRTIRFRCARRRRVRTAWKFMFWSRVRRKPGRLLRSICGRRSRRPAILLRIRLRIKRRRKRAIGEFRGQQNLVAANSARRAGRQPLVMHSVWLKRACEFEKHTLSG